MKLTEEARRAVAESDTICAGANCSVPGKVFAQLETTIVKRDGTERKDVEWVILVPPRLVANRPVSKGSRVLLNGVRKQR